MRKLATVRKIDAIAPIEGADAIEVAVVGGWKVVVKKGEFAVGDLAVYFEIDSWVPVELAPFLVKGKEPKVFEGVAGERLRTIKLRGQLSQGLLLPFGICMSNYDGEAVSTDWNVGDDVTELLGIKKWEAPISVQLAGLCKGNFPTQIPKTDQERCQNLVKEINGAIDNRTRFEITEKLEGSSMTCYLIDGEFGVCSRNMDLKRDAANSFWATAIAEDIEAKMRQRSHLDDFAIQGELIGPGIQGNIYKLNKLEFRVFDVYNITRGVYISPAERRAVVEYLGLKHAPVLVANGELYDTLGIKDVNGVLKFAEGKSVMGMSGCEREGIVFKECNGGFTFKSVSNRYLIKNDG